EDTEYDFEADPFASREELPARPPRRLDLFEAAAVTDATEPEAPTPGTSDKNVSRPALCIQPREGRLHIFLPPVRQLSEYLELVAAVEDTCRYLEMPV